MAEITVTDRSGSQVGTVTLKDELLARDTSDHVLYEAVRHLQASARAGTHKTKGRGEVRGGGKKPWRQKGTGRARVGSIRNPIWRGGGTVFGPQPRDYSYTLPKGKRLAALRKALGVRVDEGMMRVIKDLTFDDHKTKNVVGLLDKLGITNGALVVEKGDNRNLHLAARNLPDVGITTPESLNAMDVLRYPNILVTEDAFGTIEKRIAR